MRLRIQGRDLIRIGKDVEVPLVGNIAFGVIDRGTNLIQVRPNSYCALSCIFCSTDAGPRSRWRQAEYYVDRDLLLDYVRDLVKLKGGNVEAHIDTVGDPLLYDKLPDLIQEIKEIPGVRSVSLQTHGLNLTYKYADRLTSAGLDRLNLSIDTLDPEKGKYLQGCPYYNVRRVTEVAEYIIRSTPTDVILTPLYLPGINDEDIPKIIEWGLRVGAGKKAPPFGIQKYLRHKHGRRPKGVREITWREFYRYLRDLEKRYRVKLILSEEDFNIVKAPTLPNPLKPGDKIRVKVAAKGWLKNEWLALPLNRGIRRSVTVIDELGEVGVGSKVTVRVISSKHNIILTRLK